MVSSIRNGVACLSLTLVALSAESCAFKTPTSMVDAAAVTSAGATSWYTFLGGTGTENSAAIQQTSDGGYIVAGTGGANVANLGGQTPLNAYSAGNDFLVVKLTSAGAVSWYTYLGGAGGESAQSIQQTSDGGYIVAGTGGANIANLGGQTPLNAYSAGNDVLVIKLTSAGAVSWYTFLGGAGTDSLGEMHVTSDGGCIFAGQSNANIANLGGQTPLNAYSASTDFLVVKLTSAGAVTWYTFLGGTGIDGANAIQQTGDGSYIVTGIGAANIANLGGQTPLNAYSASNDMLVVKLTSAGAVTWYTFLGGSSSEQSWSIRQAGDGGYLVAGTTIGNIASLGGQTPLNAYTSGQEILMIKLTTAGAVSWYTFLGSTGGDGVQDVQPTSDGGYVIAGSTNADIANLGGQTPINAYSAGTDALLIKLTSAGAVSWYTFLGGPGAGAANAIAQTSDGGYVFVGDSSADITNLGGKTPLNAYSSGSDFMVVKLKETGKL